MSCSPRIGRLPASWILHGSPPSWRSCLVLQVWVWFVVQGLLRGGDLAGFFPPGGRKGCKIGARVKIRARSASGAPRAARHEPGGRAGRTSRGEASRGARGCPPSEGCPSQAEAAVKKSHGCAPRVSPFWAASSPVRATAEASLVFVLVRFVPNELCKITVRFHDRRWPSRGDAGGRTAGGGSVGRSGGQRTRSPSRNGGQRTRSPSRNGGQRTRSLIVCFCFALTGTGAHVVPSVCACRRSGKGEIARYRIVCAGRRAPAATPGRAPAAVPGRRSATASGGGSATAA
jgi:hypothetical protein